MFNPFCLIPSTFSLPPFFAPPPPSLPYSSLPFSPNLSLQIPPSPPHRLCVAGQRLRARGVPQRDLQISVREENAKLPDRDVALQRLRRVSPQAVELF